MPKKWITLEQFIKNCGSRKHAAQNLGILNRDGSNWSTASIDNWIYNKKKPSNAMIKLCDNMGILKWWEDIP